MTQQSLQAVGGVFNSVSAIDANFDDLYAYYGVASGDPFATNLFVNGDTGSDTNDGLTPGKPKLTIQGAINAAGQNYRVFIRPKLGDTASSDTDPDSYAETLTVAAGKDGLQLIGAGFQTHGSQPQLKIGSGSTVMLDVSASGVVISNLSINGAGSTGGGIKIENGSFGTVIQNCVFKNCKSSAAAATGGAVYWSSDGGGWNTLIRNNEFWDCRAGVVLIGTSSSAPKWVRILGNRFFAAANTTVDADIYAGGSGFASMLISGNHFGTVDVPAYATSPDAARYIKLLGGAGMISNNYFACDVVSGKTFGAAGDACIVPTTVRMAGNMGEGDTNAGLGFVYRT